MQERSRSQAPTSTAWVGLAASVVVLGALLLERTEHVVDDAYVVFRHARNWVEYGVATWNAPLAGAEAAPVEGTSSFLWLVLMRWTATLGLPLHGTAQWLGALFGVLTLRTLHRHLMRDLGLSSTPAGVGAVALAATPAFVVWCSGGLETALFTWLLLVTYVGLVRPTGPDEVRRRWLTGLAAVGVALTRPEGFLWVLGAAAVAALVHAPDEGRLRRRRLVPYFVVYLVGFGAFLFWRHATYGAWVPNPVLARIDLSGAAFLGGAKQAASWALISVLPTATFLMLPLALGGPRRAHALAALVMIGGGAAFQVVAGPDDLAFFRLLAPVSPFVALLLALELAHFPADKAWTPGILLVSLAVLPIFHVEVVPRDTREALDFRERRAGYDDEWGRFKAERDGVRRRLVVGEALAEAFGHQGAVLDPIGAAGFHYPGPVFDRHGRVDPVVARREPTAAARARGHVRQVPRAFFLDRDPAVFAARLVPEVQADPSSAVFRRHARAPLEADPEGEAALRRQCVVEVYTDESLDALRAVPGQALLVWRRVDDPERAARFWAE